MSRFTLPRDIYHGPGSLSEIAKLNGKKAFVVTGGGSMKRFGFLGKTLEFLREAGMETHVFEGVEPDPSRGVARRCLLGHWCGSCAERSRRRVAPERAGALRQALPPLVDLVALFMDNDEREVRAAIALVDPALLQFHGSEDDAFCRRFGLPYLKGVGMGGAAGAWPL